MVQSFGGLLRMCRRGCRDPLRGGLLTQERLGELIGLALGDAGYSGAAVSDWERNKSKINEDDRLVLISLIKVLHDHGGLGSAAEADQLLLAGNYRGLDPDEQQIVFGDLFNEQAASEKALRQPLIKEKPPAPILAERPAGLAYTPTAQRRKQLILLNKVRNFWVKGVLETSLRGQEPLELAMKSYPQAIDHPWDGLLSPEAYGLKKAGVSPSMLRLFRQVDRALLILGEPGSGKTTTLICLAQELIELAECDPEAAIPVVLNLGSWNEGRLPVDDWIVEELTAKYQIPRRIGRQWLDDDDLVLLLDSLDEVPVARRDECIQAINQFRERHGLSGLVVCCRQEDYESLNTRLKLSGATVLQPLTTRQIERYLAKFSPDLGANASAETELTKLPAAIRQDAALGEMAQSPLMLSVMVVAYGDSAAKGKVALDGHDLAGPVESDNEKAAGDSEPAPYDAGALSDRIFSAYVARMFRHRQAGASYTPEETTRCLAWLARRMGEHNQTVLLIEKIQPSWLPSRGLRRLYLLVACLITGLAGGLIMWLLLQLLRFTTPQLPAPLSAQVAALIGLEQGRAEFTTLILGNLCLGLVMAAILTFLFERRLVQPQRSGSRIRQGWIQAILIGSAVGLLTAATVALYTPLPLAVAWGIAEAVMYGTAARYAFGWSYGTEIRAIEALGWSWRHAFHGLVAGLILTAVAEGVEVIMYEYDGFSRTLLTLGATGMLLGGLRGRRLETSIRPNQAIWLSFRNSIIAAILTGLLLGALTWLVRDPAYGLMMGLLSAFIAGTLLGGSNLAKHFFLRLLIWRRGCLPADIVGFLDYAAGLVLLRKVGGGYIFIHRLLQEHFARSNP